MTVALLALINAIAMSAIPMMALIGSIVGAQLAPRQEWATLPIAVIVIGTALGVLPATRLMQRYGRPRIFALFLGGGAFTCLLMGQAIAWQSFTVFCLGALLLGMTTAALQQMRFAAMESVAPEDGASAASTILLAGIIAAFLGPELGLWGKHLTQHDYQGSFMLGGLCMGIATLTLVLYRPMKTSNAEHTSTSVSVAELLRNPVFVLALCCSACAYVVMSFIMTATPISMHLHHGHSLEDAKWVIQSHITAMFLPSLFTPWLFRWLGIHKMMAAGLACYSATLVIGLIDTSVLGFWGQLVMLGVGWNFLFIAGTALLPAAYSEGQQFKAQAVNDTAVFTTQAIASLAAGWALSGLSWPGLLLICAAPIGLMATLLMRSRPA